MINLIIADDHVVIRKGLQLYLNRDKNLKVIGEVSDGEELLEMVKTSDVDLILLDIDMPRMNGMTAIRHIKEIKPDVKILILSMHPEELYLLAVKKLGANGYITKDTEPRMILKAIRKIMGGGEYFNREVIKRIRSKKHPKPLVKLSKRESEVLNRLAAGLTNKEVSEELDISDKTVSTYKLRLMRKLGARSLVELVNFAKSYQTASPESTRYQM
ncbi:MAG: response regulator transcription factor [Cryomorphaceae bacterium]|nr:response regulator transcription factor [Cryomorphaceae bacterium]